MEQVMTLIKRITRPLTGKLLTASKRCLLSLLLCLSAPALAQTPSILAAPEAGGHIFSYTIIDADISAGELLVALQADVLSRIATRGATLYAVWTPAQKPIDAPFGGLANNQVGLMLAWAASPEQRVRTLGRGLKASGRGNGGVQQVVRCHLSARWAGFAD